MRLLDRYLLRELLVPFAYCLGGFSIFWVTFDLLNELGGIRRRRLGLMEVAAYELIKLPEQLVMLVPVALLLALLYTLTNHARHHELTAIRAAGISLTRIALPYLLVGGLCSIAVGVINEMWVPQTNDAAEKLWQRNVVTARTNSQTERRLNFSNFQEKRQWFIQEYNFATDEMIQPHVSWKAPGGVRHEVMAERGAYRDGIWVFTNVQELIYSGQAEPVRLGSNIRVMRELSETPAQIKAQIKISKMQSRKSATKAQLSIREILEYKKWNPGSAKHEALLDTMLHDRIASPWTCVVVVFMALPFGAASGRRNVFVGVASSILICFAYFIVQQLGFALGAGQHIPPVIGAWAPNIIFVAAGLVMLRKVR